MISDLKGKRIMPRTKKNAKIVNFNLSLQSIEALECYCTETGLTKTAALERFILQGVKQYAEQQKVLKDADLQNVCK